jgi:hypothetical protein
VAGALIGVRPGERAIARGVYVVYINPALETKRALTPPRAV